MDGCSVQDNALSHGIEVADSGVLTLINTSVCNNGGYQIKNEAGTVIGANVTTDEATWTIPLHREVDWQLYAQKEPTSAKDPGYITIECKHCHEQITTNLYMLELDANGGKLTTGNQVIPEDGKPEMPGDPTREGYTFGGWYIVTTDDDGNVVEIPFTEDMSLTQGLLLRAHWTQNPPDSDVSEKTGNTGANAHLTGSFTRADAIGYLWQQSGSPEWELSDFPDVPQEHRWAVAIGWAQDQGIALPGLDGNFRPDDLILRSVKSLEVSPEGELQEFLDRYAMYEGIKLNEGEHFYALEGAFNDVITGEDAMVIFNELFTRLEAALSKTK